MFGLSGVNGVFQGASADPRAPQHYFDQIDQEIDKAREVLENWQRSSMQINKVRELENPTVIMRARNMPDVGYHGVYATEGYNRLLNAFKLLYEDRLTPAQNQALDKAINIQDGLREETRIYGKRPEGYMAERYTDEKLSQLSRNGEVYMTSGWAGHFNVTKISRLPDGGYSYTLYDSGHESDVVGEHNGKLTVHAVREFRILPGADIRGLIAADLDKKGYTKDENGYEEAKNRLKGYMEAEPFRKEVDYAQYRSNCTTRGQRIMLADIIQDNRLSEAMYSFVQGANGTSDADIKHAIENKLTNLERIKAERLNPANINLNRQLSFDQYALAANANNYEHVSISLDNGGRMPAYRIKPGVFDYQELETLQATLQRNGVDSTLRESVAERGRYYLYVDSSYSDTMHNALARDNSIAAMQYKNLRLIVEEAKLNTTESNEKIMSQEIISIPTHNLDNIAKAELMEQLRADGFNISDRPNGSAGPNLRVYSSHEQFAEYQQRVQNFLEHKGRYEPVIKANVSHVEQERFIAEKIFDNTNIGDIDDVSLRADGVTVLTVRSSYSRTELAAALGMDETQAAMMRRQKTDVDGKMNIFIPPEAMPKAMRPNLQHVDNAVRDMAHMPADGAAAVADVVPAHEVVHNAPEFDNAREVTPITPEIDTRMSKFGGAGGGAAGSVLSYQGLEHAIERGDTTGIVISSADMAASTADLALDGSAAFGKTVPSSIVSNMGRANIALVLVDGVYQISQEEGLENQVARGVAVTATTAGAMTVGALATGATVTATGAAAVVATTAATVAAPVVAAVAVGMVADAAVDAYKAENSLGESIARSEQSVKTGEKVELNGAPSVQSYQNLNWFTICESEALMEDGMTRQDVVSKTKEHEFSNDPEALDNIQAELEAKIAEYDERIEGLDDWWIPNVLEQDDMQDKWMAQIDRARYVAALNELNDYRKDVDVYNSKAPDELVNRNGLAGSFDSALSNEDASLVAYMPEEIKGLDISKLSEASIAMQGDVKKIAQNDENINEQHQSRSFNGGLALS